MSEFTILETPRLTLRALTPEVYKNAYANWSDEEIKSFFGYANDKTLNEEIEKYEKGICTWNRSFVNFQLLEKNSGKLIGWCGFHTWATHHFRAEMGYAMGSDEYKNKGFMKEAIRPIVEYGINEMKLHRIEALVATDNVASIKVLTGLGFSFESILREHYCVNGVNEDSVMYVLLKHEYNFTV
ncbi:MAG TPA: GNAT family protein [Flavobacteriales bacterium]|nr:GNAT family protein [Flavobacteriales bacterium]